MNPMTPSQIGKLQELIGAALRKAGLQSEPVQQVLETQGKQITDEVVAVLRRFVEAVSKIITRIVKVDRGISNRQVIDNTGRKQYIDNEVLVSMPQGDGEDTEVVFFPGERTLSPAELTALYIHRNPRTAHRYW